MLPWLPSLKVLQEERENGERKDLETKEEQETKHSQNYLTATSIKIKKVTVGSFLIIIFVSVIVMIVTAIVITITPPRRETYH